MFKTKLQELCHRKSYKIPEYSIAKQGQDHVPCFEATVTVDGKQFRSQAPCKSSKQAQNEAAKLAFDFFSLPSSPSCQPPQPTPSPQPEQLRPQPVCPPPEPEQLPCIPQFPHPSLHISSFPQPSLPSQQGTSGAITNLSNKISPPQRPEVKLEVANKTFTLEESTKGFKTRIQCMQHLYKNQLQNFAQKRSLTLPIYTCERDGPPHASRFRCKVEINGKTYESPDFHATLKDAENAVAKVAFMSSCQDGAQEDSGLYKNLLQEKAQRRGLGLPTYSTSQACEVHAPIFISIVKIGEETFEGERSRTKKQAEMSAAKVAYITLKEGESSKIPLIASPRGRASQVVSSSLQSDVNTDPELKVSSSPVISHPMAIEKQPNDGGSESTSTRKRGPSSDLCGEVSRDIAISSSHNFAQPGESNNYVLNIVSKLEAGKSSSSKRVFVCPRQPNMTFPEDSTILPISDDQWVVFSLPTEASQ